MAIDNNCYEEDEERVKWLTHYSSNHQILLVGDGDFSFSLCLARSFGSAFNIVASSLDFYDEVIKKYKEAKSNLRKLHGLGATVLHGVDATKMKLHTDLRNRRFDRIVFNFPHAGFHGKEHKTRVIDLHKALVRGFFSNARAMLRPDGEIHVNHKTTAPFSRWNLEILASSSSLALIDRVGFKVEDYPRYKQRRGSGTRCSEPFPIGEASTFKFGLSPRLNKARGRYSFDPSRSQISRVSMLDYDDTYEPPWRTTSFESGVYGRSDRARGITTEFELENGMRYKERHLGYSVEIRGRTRREHSSLITDVRRGFDTLCGIGFNQRTFDHMANEHGFGSGRDSMIVHLERTLNRDTRVTPEFHQRSHHIDSRVDERFSCFDRRLSRDTRFFPETNGRTRYNATMMDSRAIFDHERRMFNDIGRTSPLRLVREYGDHEEPFSSDGNLRITRLL